MTKSNSCPLCKSNLKEIKALSYNRGKEKYHNLMFCGECSKYFFLLNNTWEEVRIQSPENILHKKEVEKKSKELFFSIWKGKFTNLKTKKKIWQVLTIEGKYKPDLRDFYEITKNFNKTQMQDYIKQHFVFEELRRILDVCDVEPDWKKLGINNERERKIFDPKLGYYVSDLYLNSVVTSEQRPKRERIELYKNSTDYSALPSKDTDRFWIYAKRMKGEYSDHTVRGGKWLIFVDPIKLDEVWLKIKKAVEEGLLGNDAKVSTMKRSTNVVDYNKKVICVYTYDWTDEKDVMNIRDRLRELGITEAIPYKSDEDTLKGKYRKSGNTRISKYFC